MTFVLALFFTIELTGQAAVCRAEGGPKALAELPEASGAAAGRGTLIYSHNDSGRPEVFAIDPQTAASRRIAIEGVTVQDWEALASAPCDAGRCLYIADIGDNDARRRTITIHRIAEPPDGAASAKVLERIEARYPDGSHDAETLLVGPGGDLHVLTKGDTGAVGLYRVPRERAGGTVQLERIGGGYGSGRPGPDDRITDGAVSPGGDWVVLRTRTSLRFHRAREFFAGHWREVHRVDLASLGEPQGEGVTFGPGGTLHLLGEGGGKARPGTLITMRCTL